MHGTLNIKYRVSYVLRQISYPRVLFPKTLKEAVTAANPVGYLPETQISNFYSGLTTYALCRLYFLTFFGPQS